MNHSLTCSIVDMSYNSYPNSTPNYSSYLQQPANVRSQLTDQSKNTYPSNSYQPLSAYQISQRPQTYTPQSNSSSNANHYQNYGSGASDGRSQDSRAGYTDGRSSVDTTALGNLAYASSLGRDSATPAQAAPYNSNQPNSGYRYPGAYGSSPAQPSQDIADHGRIGAQPTVTSRADSRTQGATSSPSFGYSANIGNTPQIQQQGSGNSVASIGQQTHSASQQYQTSQFNQPPSRPSSVQAVHQAHSRNASQGLQSPSLLANKTARSSKIGQQTKSSPVSNARVPTSQQQMQQQSPYQPPSAQSTNHRPAIPNASAKPSPHTQPVPSKDATQSATTNKSSNSQSNKASMLTTNQSLTVDPSQVFNDVEYQRRQAAAADAEAARKKAIDVQIATQAKENQNAPHPASNQPSRVPSAAPSSSDAELEKKNQMELEMKNMIEKMRDYKSKDPSLFSQIWEQVKKGQPTPRTPAQPNPQASAVSPVVTDVQLPSPGPQVQLPPESELPAAEPFPIGSDRGRFPAQRRRRGGANYAPPKKAATPKGTSSVAPPVDPVQKAMQEFHGSLEVSRPPVTPPVAQMTEQRPATTHSTVSNQSSIPSATMFPKLHTPPAQPPKAGGTYWPENKKRQLAEAARNALTSLPRNAGKRISTDDLHALLDQNPSYTQMCEILEYRGFAIDRGQFARQLLAAVPDLGSASSKAASVARPPSQGVPTLPAAPPPSSLPPAARPWPQSVRRDTAHKAYVTPYALSDPSGQSPQDPRWLGPDTNKIPNQTFNTSMTNDSRSGPRHAPFPPAPPKLLNTVAGPSTKQDMARKRSFGEIVDLTQGMSDDEDEPPRQRSRIENEGDRQMVGQSSAENAHGSDTRQVPGQAATDIRVGKDGKPLDSFRFNPTDTAAGKYLHSLDIVQPMNKRQDALRRSSYNPKTIARDILVALGKHPTMAPLNAHLENLRETFTAVNHDSDLSTIRWDLIDPGGPPAPPAPEKVSSTDTDLKRRPSVAVMVGDGKSKAKHHGKGLKPTRGGHFTAFARPKGESTPELGPHFDFSRYIHNDLPAILDPITGHSASTSASKPYKIARNNYLSQSSTPVSNSINVDSSSPATSSGPRRVGRPPGARNKNPRPDKSKFKGSKTAPASAQKEGTATQDADPRDEENTPPPREEPPSQSLINSIPNRPRVQTTPAKPSGLRNAMSPTDGIAVVIPSRSPSIALPSRASSEMSSKNRRLSIANGVNDKQFPAPSYAVYKCRWEGCPAELHNLETLKKHMRKHRKPKSRRDSSLLCLWKDCYLREYTASQLSEADAVAEDERLSFEDEKAWDKHVEGVHINAMAKELGGDPSTASLGKAIEDFSH